MESIQAGTSLNMLGKSLDAQKLGTDLINKTLAANAQAGAQAAPQAPGDQAFQQSVLASQGVGRNVNIST